MGRIFITGSTDGLGLAVADQVLDTCQKASHGAADGSQRPLEANGGSASGGHHV
jgi:NAD(P)-dependent dehydrogenase (short-subunit alcohol dehydrogenase family)